MASLTRYLVPQVRRDLAKKMVFVAGPRQVGKTTLARGLRYLKARFPKCEAWQISATGTKDYVTPDDIRVAPAMQLLPGLV